MTIQELDQVIREYFKDIYNKEYIGKLDIYKLNPIGYHVNFIIYNPEQPFTVCAYLNDIEFLKFIRKEIHSSKFKHSFYGELNLRYPTNCYPIDTSCKCHDKG